MAFASDTLVGHWPFERDATSAQGDPSLSVPGVSLGTTIAAYDSFFGAAEFVFVKFATASTAVPFGSVVIWDDAHLVAKTAAAASVVSGQPLGVLASRFPSDAAAATSPLFGWVCIRGRIPATFSATATTGALYLGTAGNFTPTAANGKQVLGAITLLAASNAISKVCQTQNGGTELVVPNKSGLYPGVTVSGTGIAAGTVTTLDSGSNNKVVLSAAMTATGSVTVTFTDTGFGQVRLMYPSAQGQVV